MIIGGLQKVSLIDYPGEVSSVIFTRGCNMRCIYCHNAHLVLPEHYAAPMDKEDILSFLYSRKHKIKAVVISGGEPTLHRDLPEFIESIKQLGYKIKLDTNGTNPDMLKNLLDKNMLDFVAMDIKAPLEKYPSICGIEVDLRAVVKSIEIIKESGIKYEFRTTILKNIHTKEDIDKIKLLTGDSVTLNNFRFTDSVLNKNLSEEYEFLESEMSYLTEG